MLKAVASLLLACSVTCVALFIIWPVVSGGALDQGSAFGSLIATATSTVLVMVIDAP